MRIGESSIGIERVGLSNAENKRAKDQLKAHKILEASRAGSDVDALLLDIKNPQDLQSISEEFSILYAQANDEEMSIFESIFDKMEDRMKELKGEVIAPREQEPTLEDNATEEKRLKQKEIIEKLSDFKADVMKKVFDFYDVTPGSTGAENKMARDVDQIARELQSLLDEMGNDNIQRFELRALADSLRAVLRNHIFKEEGTGTFRHTGKELVERHSTNIEIDKAMSSLDNFLSKIPLPTQDAKDYSIDPSVQSAQDVQPPTPQNGLGQEKKVA